MSDELERRRQHVKLGTVDINNLLAPLNVDVVKAELLQSGKLNTNYKVFAVGRDAPLVLRLYTNDPIACDRDRSILKLVNNKVPVAKMLLNAPTAGELEIPYAVFEWIDGLLMDDALDSDCRKSPEVLAAAAGHTLASLSQFEFPKPGFLMPDLGFSTEFDSVTASFRAFLSSVERRGRVAARVGVSKFKKMIQFVDANITSLSVTEQRYCLVHADYTVSNLIVRERAGDWSVRAVLDWEFAMAGSPIFDIGVFLRNEDAFDSAFTQEFARAYVANGGHLPAGWRRASKMLDLLNQFAFLDTTEEFPKTFVEATRRVDKTIGRWDSFEDT